MRDRSGPERERVSAKAHGRMLALASVGLLLVIAAALYLERHSRCVQDGVEEARAAGLMLDVRCTRAIDSKPDHRATACLEVIDRIRRQPAFEELRKHSQESARARIDLEGDLEFLARIRAAESLFAAIDELPPTATTHLSPQELRSDTILTIKLLSLAVHSHLTAGDREGAERAISRVLAIADAFHGSIETWNVRYRLEALEQATQRMLTVLPTHPNPEAWVNANLPDDGSGAWRDCQEYELTLLVEALDPSLVNSTPSTRIAPQFEFVSIRERWSWPEQLSALLAINAQSRRIADSGDPKVLERIGELEKNATTLGLTPAPYAYSPVLEFEIRVRSASALVHAAARVLERVRRAGFDAADLTELGRNLPIDVETGAPFQVVRSDDTIVVRNETNSRLFRIARDALLEK